MESRSLAGRWKQIFGGLVAAFLLLPVPAYAAISFVGNTWIKFSDTTSSALSINGTSDNNTLILNIDHSTAISGTIVFRSTGITALDNDTIGGTFTELADINLSSGSFTLSVTTTNFKTPSTDGNLLANTMFSTGTQPSNQNFAQKTLSGNPLVEITFTFTDAQFATQPSTPWTSFDFTS